MRLKIKVKCDMCGRSVIVGDGYYQGNVLCNDCRHEMAIQQRIKQHYIKEKVK